MRGLLVKDFRLFFMQRQFLTIILLLTFFFAVSGQGVHFIVTYATMLCIYFTISTVSYDELNRGYAFLFTLPISRRGYVLEKYLFALLLGGGAWAVTTAGSAVYLYLTDPSWNKAEWVGVTGIIFPVLWLMIALMLPLQLKFGAEKSRISLIVLIAFMFGVFSFVVKLRPNLPQEFSIENLPELSMGGWIAVGAAVVLAATFLSVAVSMHIMSKKQF